MRLIDESLRRNIESIRRVAVYRPKLAVAIIIVGLLAAVLEGIGMSFLIPIINSIGQGSMSSSNGTTKIFERVFELLQIPYNLETIIVGVTIVLFVRFSTSFLVAWLRAKFRTGYVADLRSRSFDKLLDGRVEYFDVIGSDEIINTIITETFYAGNVINYGIQTVEKSLLSIIYLSIALYIAPVITVLTGLGFALVLFGMRYVLESGYSIGRRVGEANEGLQRVVQSAILGIRDVKSFGIANELRDDFRDEIDTFEEDRVKAQRNIAAIGKYYQFATAVTIFVLIYVMVTMTTLTVGELSLYLFSMFRLGPKLSQITDHVYKVESDLPHLRKTHSFIDELDERQEPSGGSEAVPEPITPIRFADVSFAYGDETILSGISFDINSDDFVAIVGQSGAGKSTIVSLLMRHYKVAKGRITANGIPINEFPIDDWRSSVSIVRQDPYIFDDTLWNNITIGQDEVSERKVREVADIAQVTEFVEDLPAGYDTALGEDGVRLSGGQKQRVAVARALVKDADLLILDEATSDLDTSLEDAIHEGIEGMDRECALVVIAHRMSTVTNADLILTLDSGRIAASGTHDELLEEHGKYHELYSNLS